MIGRARGEHDDHHYAWRPQRNRQTALQREPSDDRPPEAVGGPDATTESGPDGTTEPFLDSDGSYEHPGAEADLDESPAPYLPDPSARRRPSGVWRLLVVVLGVAAVQAASHSPSPARVNLPRTPRAWLDALRTDGLKQPGRTCARLFSPGFAGTSTAGGRTGCARSLAGLENRSLASVSMFAHGSTAVLEPRQHDKHAAWTIVLDRHAGGWQAVALLKSS